MARLKLAAFSILAVALFFGAAEAICRLAGVRPLLEESDPAMGFAGSERVFERDTARGVWATPPRVTRHSFNYQEFRIDKPRGGFRVFTLGGSSAWGFPWGARVAFPRALGRALAASYPGRSVESVNAAAMSYGSARLRRLTAEILTYAPDLLVVFEGHNEFVERDLADRIESAPRPAAGIRILLRSSLYAALTRAWESVRPREKDTAPEAETGVGQLLGLDVVRQTERYADDARKAEAVGRFRTNFEAIVDAARAAGVPVVVCTVPSNLAGWAPNQSVFDPSIGAMERQAIEGTIRSAREGLARGAAEPAARLLEAAAARAPGHAEVRFRLGEAYAALGRYEDARREFRLARDLDAMPTRALGAINEAIRGLAGIPGVTIVDVEALFDAEAEHGLPGFDLLEDYVHPKPHAHRIIAKALWRAILEGGLAGARIAADPAVFDAAVPESESIVGSADGSPNLLYNLGIVFENRGMRREAAEKFRECLAKDPTHVAAAYNLGRLLHVEGRFEEAAAAHRQALASDPGYVLAMVGLGEALRAAGRGGEARSVLEGAVRADPGNAYAWNGLGAVLAASSLPVEAERAFRRAVDAQPERVDSRANLGMALLAQGKTPEAEATFREALRMRPEHIGARDGLAATLIESGQLDEAQRLFEETLRLAPQDRFARAGIAEIARRRGR